jgi:hypothetical protein
MASPIPIAGCADDAVVICTHDDRELEAITNPTVQAVIYIPPALPAWFTDVASAVLGGALSIPRSVLPSASRNAIDNWLEQNLPITAVTPEVRGSLKDDVLGLVNRLGSLSHASRFMLRIFTEAPTTECGFHVDSVPPGAPTWGFLRVYNGAGTEYVHPANVTSMADFYRYLSRRERLIRESKAARSDGSEAEYARLQQAIADLDNERAFLVRREEIGIAPAGSIVAFKHIDIRYHWSNHSKAMTWIHCSPMAGEPRLVVNVTAPEPIAHTVPRARGETAR